jgi:hypothetical protein
MAQNVEVNGQIIEFPDGMSAADMEGAIKASFMSIKPAEKPAAVTAGKAINSLPRQLGLTARYALEGPAQTAQIFTEPVAALMRSAGVKVRPTGEQASALADWLGLPRPQGANERVIGDASRLVTGGGAMLRGAQAASAIPGVAGKVFASMAANPTQQLGAAAGAGLAGGASREAGGDGLMQAGASLLGGVAGGLTPSAASGVANAGRRILAPALNPHQIDIKLTETLGRAGVDYSKLPGQVQRQLRDELAASLKTGKQLDPQAVSRLADFKTVGATPTRGMISQNPVQITREMNLAKVGANSADDSLHGMAMIQNRNNAQMIRNLNDLGANRGDVQRAGEAVTGSIFGKQAGLRGSEQSLWDTAKASPGYKQPISAGVLSDVNAALDSEGLMPFMNPKISNYIKAFQMGQPFTPQAYKNLQSMLSNEAARGGNEGAAASLAARVMRDGDLMPAGFQAGGNALVNQGVASHMRGVDDAATGAIDAVNAARRATRAAYSYEDSSPLVRSVLSDGRTSDPVRIAQSYIIGGTAKEAKDVMQQVGPQGVAPIKEAILGHLKDKALSGASDETGKFSQAAFNRALNAIGKDKLALIFSPEELHALNTNARVASLMMSQPVGSAVNNSNSGALLLGRGMDLLNKIPVVGPLAGPSLKNIEVSLRQRQAANYQPGLLKIEPRPPLLNGLLLPGMVASGGLLSQ